MTIVSWFVIENIVMVDHLYELLSPFPLSNASISLHFVPTHTIHYDMLGS